MAKDSAKKKEGKKTEEHWQLVSHAETQALANPQQEIFAQALAAGAIQSEAYMMAYGGVTEPKLSTARTNGCVLAKKPHIIKRVAWLKHRERLAFDVNQTTLTQHCLDIIEGAKRAGDWGAARAALADLAKLHGLMIERSEVNGTVRHIGELHLDALKNLMGSSTGRRDKHLKVVDAQVEPVEEADLAPKRLAGSKA